MYSIFKEDSFIMLSPEIECIFLVAIEIKLRAGQLQASKYGGSEAKTWITAVLQNFDSRNYSQEDSYM